MEGAVDKYLLATQKKLLDEDVDLSLIEEQLKMCVQCEDTDG